MHYIHLYTHMGMLFLKLCIDARSYGIQRWTTPLIQPSLIGDVLQLIIGRTLFIAPETKNVDKESISSLFCVRYTLGHTSHIHSDSQTFHIVSLFLYPCITPMHFSAWAAWIAFLLVNVQHYLTFTPNDILFQTDAFHYSDPHVQISPTFIFFFTISALFPQFINFYHSAYTSWTPHFYIIDFALVHTVVTTTLSYNLLFTPKLTLLTVHTFCIASKVFKPSSTLIFTSSCEPSSSMK